MNVDTNTFVDTHTAIIRRSPIFPTKKDTVWRDELATVYLSF